jgi:hypothetical protein
MSNNNSIWFAVDEDGQESWFDDKPIRSGDQWQSYTWPRLSGFLFEGAIQAITGRTITWADEPIEWVPGEVNGIKYPCEEYCVEQANVREYDDATPELIFLEGCEFAIRKTKELNQ